MELPHVFIVYRLAYSLAWQCVRVDKGVDAAKSLAEEMDKRLPEWSGREITVIEGRAIVRYAPDTHEQIHVPAKHSYDKGVRD